MTDIVEFISTRLAEDEQVARAAADFPYDEPTDAPWWAMKEAVRRGYASTSDAHGALNDPDATLRRCVMVRAMLRHAEDAADNERTLEEEAGWRVRDYSKSPLADVRMHRDIAAYWNTHPDYRPEWAPVPDFTGPPVPPCQHTNVIAHGNTGGMYSWHCEDCQLSYSDPRNLAACDVSYFLCRIAQQQGRPQR